MDDMYDREQVIKSLKWLILNYPLQENPKDDGDRIRNAFHVYAENAVKLLEDQGPQLITLEEVRALGRYISVITPEDGGVRKGSGGVLLRPREKKREKRKENG